MNLKGVIATLDALNSQTKNVKAVVNAGGDYIILYSRKFNYQK